MSATRRRRHVGADCLLTVHEYGHSTATFTSKIRPTTQARGHGSGICSAGNVSACPEGSAGRG
jgi:hypothetical protein